MNWRSATICINRVGPSTDRFVVPVGRGVFNLDSILDYLAQPVGTDLDEIIVDLTPVGWVGLFDWWCFTTLLHKRLDENPRLKISLDFIGAHSPGLIPYGECAENLGKESPSKYTKRDYLNSHVVHRLLSFVRAVEGAEGFSNVAGGRLVLRHVTGQYARQSGWYRQNSEIEESVFLPRTSVSAKQMCVLFATRKQIGEWRRGMAEKRVPEAAVFHSEEFWRILCHELARNVFEHAEGPGFITARVVVPVRGELPHWCNEVYDKVALDRLGASKDSGFLELCVCDAGRGIPATIGDAYKNRYAERHASSADPKPRDEDLLKFAFDELGTRKDAEHSWLTDRHALGNILFVVAKYGGALSIRSGRAALLYCPADATFHRCATQLGYEPQDARNLEPAIPGTHIQILIPLVPLSRDGKRTATSVLTRHLPNSFHVDFRHPLGALVPVRDKLGAFAMCVEGDDLVKFKNACRALAESLLSGGHSREEVLAFDFAEVDWSPAQFETFLYLLQNVLVGRPVLFTNVSRTFAELVNGQEDNPKIPTYLLKEMQDEVHKRVLEREFITDGLFLETYSSLGALVLGLDPDEGEYLFGVRNGRLRQALLEIVHEEGKTVDGLAKSHGLAPTMLQAVLNAARFLFEPREGGCWGAVWRVKAPTQKGQLINTLEVQRLRSITRHFDGVAAKCDAWRGKPPQSTASTVRPERFYLPTENAVYSEFLETNRILARERYAIEIAERLIFRLCHGLTNHCDPPLSLHDVDVLACSTTPSVMLAEAIRRAWPVGRDDKRPVVIDYGPSLFSGAHPAQIPVAGDDKPRVIVVHDLFDEGRLSSQLVAMIEKQMGHVLFVLSFIRFVPPDQGKENESVPFPLHTGWEVHPRVGKPVHALIGLSRPSKIPRENVTDWGIGDDYQDQVVDPRALRPVPLRTLRLESRYSEDRSLTKRDSCLKEFDTDGDKCKLAAGHYVYGQRHFAVVVDVRSLLIGAVGHKIMTWLADVCCNKNDRDVPWEDKRRPVPNGEVSDLLLPLHSQIHYLLPRLQTELAQRGRRVPHFFLDAASFGGGVEQYEVPYQLRAQIMRAAEAIKTLKDAKGEKNQEEKISAAQLRILLIDDAIFSAKTLQTLLDSLAQQCEVIKVNVYGRNTKYPDPICWVRAFVVLNQLPTARSALLHQLRSCSASAQFRFDEYAPFIGAATFSDADCPACREDEQLEHLERRVEQADATDALTWVQKRRKAIAPLSTEAPSFHNNAASPLPEPIDVLALTGEAAPDRYKPLYADSAIWRFYELMHLSYPLGDILTCLRSTREAGKRHKAFRAEYARFRLAVYDWCIQNWHRVRLYNSDEQILGELKAEVEGGESILVEVIYRLSGVLPDETVSAFVKWAIDFLAEEDRDSRRMLSDSALALDTSLTLLFLTLRQMHLEATGLFKYLRDKQARATRKSSLLSLLFLRLTRPMRVANPEWALNTIAETCFRGSFGDTPEERCGSDHELLGRLVADAARKPKDQELRRRLEGGLHAFIAAGENLQPYFDHDLLSPVINPALSVLDWLRLPLSDALADITPVRNLSVSMQSKESWVKFAEACHMSATEFSQKLKARLAELREAADGNRYGNVEPEIEVDGAVKGWHLMTHIPRLIACLSNIALEPLTEVKPTQPSRIVCKPCAPKRPESMTVEVRTYFGAAQIACDVVNKSAKIAHSLGDLRLFGISVEPPSPAPDEPEKALLITFVVPVGFQPKGDRYAT